jgi:AcrR family transcriptional regulator
MPPHANERQLSSSRSDERVRLRSALIDLCFERGYQALALEDLLLCAGVDADAFGRHFADLEDCFCQVYAEERDLILERIVAACADLSDWRDRVRATAYSIHRSFSDPPLARLVVVEVLTAGERAQRLQWEALRQMLNLIDQGRTELEGPASVSNATAEAIAGGVFNQVYAMVAEGPLPPAEKIVPQMLYVAMLPYLGSEAALEELSIPPPEAK